MNIVGQQVKRVDAYGKVTGEAKYTADLEPRDILHGKVVHSTIANGLVKSFDLTEAYQVPGVVYNPRSLVINTSAFFFLPNIDASISASGRGLSGSFRRFLAVS